MIISYSNTFSRISTAKKITKACAKKPNRKAKKLFGWTGENNGSPFVFPTFFLLKGKGNEGP